LDFFAWLINRVSYGIVGTVALTLLLKLFRIDIVFYIKDTIGDET